MCVAAIYSHLGGSCGQVHLQLPQAFLDDICRLFEHQDLAYVGKIRGIRIAPDRRRQNRLRIKVKLSRDLWQDISEMLLNTFGDDGLEIQIDQTCATHADPRIQASFETGTPGIRLAEILVNAINKALEPGNVIEMKTHGDWWSLHPYKAFLTLNPFVLLNRFIGVVPALGRFVPPQLVDHLTCMELTTLGGCLNVDLTWRHTG